MRALILLILSFADVPPDLIPDPDPLLTGVCFFVLLAAGDAPLDEFLDDPALWRLRTHSVGSKRLKDPLEHLDEDLAEFWADEFLDAAADERVEPAADDLRDPAAEDFAEAVADGLAEERAEPALLEIPL